MEAGLIVLFIIAVFALLLAAKTVRMARELLGDVPAEVDASVSPRWGTLEPRGGLPRR